LLCPLVNFLLREQATERWELRSGTATGAVGPKRRVPDGAAATGAREAAESLPTVDQLLLPNKPSS